MRSALGRMSCPLRRSGSLNALMQARSLTAEQTHAAKSMRRGISLGERLLHSMKARTYDLLHLLLRETRDERRQEVCRCGHARAVHDRPDPCQRPAWQAPGSVHHLVQLQHHAADVRHRGARAGGVKLPFGYSVVAILLGNGADIS